MCNLDHNPVSDDLQTRFFQAVMERIETWEGNEEQLENWVCEAVPEAPEETQGQCEELWGVIDKVEEYDYESTERIFLCQNNEFEKRLTEADASLFELLTKTINGKSLGELGLVDKSS